MTEEIFQSILKRIEEDLLKDLVKGISRYLSRKVSNQILGQVQSHFLIELFKLHTSSQNKAGWKIAIELHFASKPALITLSFFSSALPFSGSLPSNTFFSPGGIYP